MKNQSSNFDNYETGTITIDTDPSNNRVRDPEECEGEELYDFYKRPASAEEAIDHRVG